MNSPLCSLWHKLAPHVTVRKVMDGLTIYFDLNDNIDDLTRPSFLRRETMTKWICEQISGNYWDVGCNIGQFAVPAATTGHNVVAFDISPHACRLLQKTATANKLAITVVDQALSIKHYSYSPPHTSRTDEKVCTDNPQEGGKDSLNFHDAWITYGPPTLVKMDIEGSEKAFLHSHEWKSLVREKGIFWLLEIHPPLTTKDDIWTDVPFLVLDEYHFLIYHDQITLENLYAKRNAS